MSLRCLHLNLLAFISILFWVSLSHAGSPLPADFAAELEQKFSAAATKEIDVQSLLQQAMKKSKTKTLKEFLNRVVRFCELDGRQAARVNQMSEERTFFLTRSLEEPADSSRAALESFYAERVKASLPKGTSLSDVAWSFEPDFVMVKTVNDKSEICIKPGGTAEGAIEYLAHEMVHYNTSEDLHKPVDALDFKNARDYAEKAVLAPGDEVDAYKLEYSLRVRRQGKGFLKDQPLFAALYNDDGKYVGRNENFSKYVLDDLGYYKFRFRDQYRRLLDNQIQTEAQRIRLDQSLRDNRKTQETEIKAAIKSRSNFMGTLSNVYKADTIRYEKILERAVRSQERLSADLIKREKRRQELEQKMRNFELSTT